MDATTLAQPPSPGDGPSRVTTRTPGFRLAVLALVCTILLLVAPLLIVSSLADDGLNGTNQAVSETAVGIGVILRATARRIIDFGARGALRTAASAMLRAVSRTLTRRLTRVALHAASGAIARNAMGRTLVASQPISLKRSMISLALGFFGLGLSFVASVHFADATTAGLMRQEFGMPWILMIFLSAIPLLVYAGLIHMAAVRNGVEARFATEIDGVLLQAYFSGAGSFLPMMTDMVIQASPKKTAEVAFTALMQLFGCHLILLIGAYLLDSQALLFVASMFLLYAFIFCFPIAPMEGHAIWRESRWRWCMIFIPILISFVLSMPISMLDVI